MATSWKLLAAATMVAGAVAACASEDEDPRKSHKAGGDDPAAPGDPSAPVGDGTTDPVDLPVVHLTSAQYARTLADLFAPIAVTPAGVPVEAPGASYDTAARAQALGAQHVEAYRENAIAVANAAVAKLDTFVGCTPKAPAEEGPCLDKWIDRFGKRAYRRPLSDAEKKSLAEAFAEARKDADFPTAVSLVVQVVLQSPSFLYRVERGEPNPSGATVQLTSYEVASRLSYFLWNTMPDDALFGAADKNALKKTEDVEAQARRMLADPKAKAAIASFHAAWLRFDRMKPLTKDKQLYPKFDEPTAQALRDGAAKYVEEVFFGDGSLKTLFTDSNAWVNEKTAPLWGVTGGQVKGDALSKVPVDPTQRAGILTNVGWLAGLGHDKESAPVLRGVTILDRVVCRTPPPPNLANVTPPPIDPGTPMTTRQRLEKRHNVEGCIGCHKSIDGIGFGFENYDAVGAWRTKDNGFDVDASGQYQDKPYVGAVELSKRFAEDPTVHACVSNHWMRYALGLEATDVLPKNVESVTKRFEDAKLDTRELVLAIVKSDMFRMRVVARAP